MPASHEHYCGDGILGANLLSLSGLVGQRDGLYDGRSTQCCYRNTVIDCIRGGITWDYVKPSQSESEEEDGEELEAAATKTSSSSCCFGRGAH